MISLVFSDALFSGFTVNVNKKELYNVLNKSEYLVNLFKASMLSVFESHNFEILVDKVKNLPTLHIHDNMLDNLKDDDTVYICSHCLQQQ